jgi:hypothetical protein
MIHTIQELSGQTLIIELDTLAGHRSSLAGFRANAVGRAGVP